MKFGDAAGVYLAQKIRTHLGASGIDLNTLEKVDEGLREDVALLLSGHTLDLRTYHRLSQAFEVSGDVSELINPVSVRTQKRTHTRHFEWTSKTRAHVVEAIQKAYDEQDWTQVTLPQELGGPRTAVSGDLKGESDKRGTYRQISGGLGLDWEQLLGEVGDDVATLYQGTDAPKLGAKEWALLIRRRLDELGLDQETAHRLHGEGVDYEKFAQVVAGESHLETAYASLAWRLGIRLTADTVHLLSDELGWSATKIEAYLGSNTVQQALGLPEIEDAVVVREPSMDKKLPSGFAGALLARLEAHPKGKEQARAELVANTSLEEGDVADMLSNASSKGIKHVDEVLDYLGLDLDDIPAPLDPESVGQMNRALGTHEMSENQGLIHGLGTGLSPELGRLQEGLEELKEGVRELASLVPSNLDGRASELAAKLEAVTRENEELRKERDFLRRCLEQSLGLSGRSG